MNNQIYLDRLTELAVEICKQHKWKVIRITELDVNYSALGININRGSEIKIKLKNVNNIYYPWFELVGTLCHELAHNRIDEHSPEFYRFMDKIHDDIEKLPRYEEIFAEMSGEYYNKGYTIVTPTKTNKKSKYYISSNGNIINTATATTSPKPTTKEGRRTVVLQSLMRRGIISANNIK